MSSPKVFVSHASEDKERFVEAFARRLRANGIDAWLDKWEMLPGDSLVDKIFEEGLAQASAVLVILSEHSVKKPWVREELNAAVVRRINSKSKLIPIVLDDCEIPECLTSTIWERISNFESYDEKFGRIISAITGQIDKPALGSLPRYTTSPIKEIGGLARIDNLILKVCAQLALERGHGSVEGRDLQAAPELQGISEQELQDSIEILEQGNLVTATHFITREMPHLILTTYGFQQFGQVYIEDYSARIERIALALINQNLQDNNSIVEQLSENIFFVDHSLSVLESNQYVKLSRSINGHIFVINVSASLRRAFV